MYSVIADQGNWWRLCKKEIRTPAFDVEIYMVQRLVQWTRQEALHQHRAVQGSRTRDHRVLQGQPERDRHQGHRQCHRQDAQGKGHRAVEVGRPAALLAGAPPARMRMPEPAFAGFRIRTVPFIRGRRNPGHWLLPPGFLPLPALHAERFSFSGQELPGPCGPRIPYSRRHICGCPPASVPAPGWTRPPGNAGHARRKAWSPRTRKAP